MIDVPHGFYGYLNEWPHGGSGRKQVGRPRRDRKKIGASRKAARRNR